MIDGIPTWCWWTLCAGTVAYWFFGGGDGTPMRPLQPFVSERDIHDLMRNR
ncbi:MAG: hypothetical protein HYZ50_20260 [Deltaproteobacteria bacterium]|nr:hypothetical protein [Deltaproteobacteria bacterium]